MNGRKDRGCLTAFWVSMAGKELSKPSSSSVSTSVRAGAPEKSPPSRSSSPSSTLAVWVSLDAKRSASSPKAARSRSRKFPPSPALLGRASFWPERKSEFRFQQILDVLDKPASMSSSEGNRSAMLWCSVLECLTVLSSKRNVSTGGWVACNSIKTVKQTELFYWSCLSVSKL